jgi:hypothetical protein
MKSQTLSTRSTSADILPSTNRCTRSCSEPQITFLVSISSTQQKTTG